MIEYSAHMIPEGGFKNLSKLYGNGVIVVGDAAGMALNAGLYIEGINFALESGRVAGEAAKKILESNNYTKKSTKIYKNELKKSFAYQDLKTFKRAAKFLENERIFAHYPELINGLFYRLLKNDGKPREKITRAAIKHILSRAKLLGAIKDVIGGLTSL
jgi:electron transfer flavoprotein-quinone oxidoreductase